jgi:hypothetical protein
MPQGRAVTVNNRMQSNYSYERVAPKGMRSFPATFRPPLSPQKMLRMGVFEGKYLNDAHDEYPRSWFFDSRGREHKSLAQPRGRDVARVGVAQPRGRDVARVADEKLNYFGIKSRLSLQEWKKRGWIPVAPGDKDKRGWFEWYCRYYMGRRGPTDDIQMKRWRAIARHAAQVKKNCIHMRGGRCTRPFECRPRQRQTLLQWAYDPLI